MDKLIDRLIKSHEESINNYKKLDHLLPLAREFEEKFSQFISLDARYYLEYIEINVKLNHTDEAVEMLRWFAQKGFTQKEKPIVDTRRIWDLGSYHLIATYSDSSNCKLVLKRSFATSHDVYELECIDESTNS